MSGFTWVALDDSLRFSQRQSARSVSEMTLDLSLVCPVLSPFLDEIL